MPKHYRKPGKKKEGNAARFITRSQAVKLLQVSLPLFRRLCILKGIFPREPKKKVKGNHQTYYHTKDILFLRYEPLVEKFREMRAYDKKVKKAWKKKNKDLAERLLSRKPGYTLDRLIRERYPRFIDVLGDLDDSLSMVHLFASLPASESEKIGVKRIHNCRRLCHEWQAYITRTHKLRKTYISVKGIYYQAEVEGQKITWITPHALQQVLTDDIDFNVMLTFLEFYETLLAFVNFKLYHSINVRYPPILDPQLESLAADLYALSRYSEAKASAMALVGPEAGSKQQHDGQQLGKTSDESELRLAQLQYQLPLNEPSLMHLVEDTAVKDDEDEETKECKSIFKGMKFFLSREVPRESLLFIIPAFGGSVSWEGGGAPFKETDQTITHQIVDRPVQGHKFLSREYVQPQWAFDCVNARVILPTDEYVVGRIPPPHLSPFVDNDKEGYAPDYAKTIKQLQAAAKKQILPMPGIGKEDMDEPHNLLLEGAINRSEVNEAAEKKQKMLELEKKYHEELRVELQGISAPHSFMEERSAEDEDARDERQRSILDKVADDTTIMEKLMMPRKQKELLKAMEISNQRKDEKNELLHLRKRKSQAGQMSVKKRSK